MSDRNAVSGQKNHCYRKEFDMNSITTWWNGNYDLVVVVLAICTVALVAVKYTLFFLAVLN